MGSRLRYPSSHKTATGHSTTSFAILTVAAALLLLFVWSTCGHERTSYQRAEERPDEYRAATKPSRSVAAASEPQATAERDIVRGEVLPPQPEPCEVLRATIANLDRALSQASIEFAEKLSGLNAERDSLLTAITDPVLAAELQKPHLRSMDEFRRAIPAMSDEREHHDFAVHQAELLEQALEHARRTSKAAGQIRSLCADGIDAEVDNLLRAILGDKRLVSISLRECRLPDGTGEWILCDTLQHTACYSVSNPPLEELVESLAWCYDYVNTIPPWITRQDEPSNHTPISDTDRTYVDGIRTLDGIFDDSVADYTTRNAPLFTERSAVLEQMRTFACETPSNIDELLFDMYYELPAKTKPRILAEFAIQKQKANATALGLLYDSLRAVGHRVFPDDVRITAQVEQSYGVNITRYGANQWLVFCNERNGRELEFYEIPPTVENMQLITRAQWYYVHYDIPFPWCRQ